MKERGTDLTRRSFLGKGALALSVGAISSTALLAGCTSPDSGTQKGGSSGADPADDNAKTIVGTINELNPQEDYTAFTTDFSAIFSPLQIGSITLKNRIVKSPAGSDTWEPDGDQLNENFLEYYENFAKGGASLVFTESSIGAYIGIDVENKTGTGWFGARLDEAEQLLGPVVERIHKHDAYIGFQLAGPGGPMTPFDFNEVSIEDLEWVQQIMTDTALAYKTAGYDVCELHCAAEQPISVFMAPRGNTRTDKYGGTSVENRTRFVCELIAKIKDACGSDYPIQILMNAVEENDMAIGDNDGFFTLQDSIENAKAFEAAGADTLYLRLNVPGLHIAQFAPDLMFSGYKSEGMTGYGTRFDFSQHFGGSLTGQYSGCGLLLEACAEFKKHISIPVSAAGYMDPRTAPDLINNAIADGEIDYLMMTRPLTVDPELPNKLQEGRHDEIAPCCRCMHCHNKGGPEGSGAEWCRVNATTQHAYEGTNGRMKAVMPEGYEPLPAQTRKKVLVAGAGPGGMEAARIAAQRGHDVTLFEKESTVGGLIKTAHAYKGDHERLGDLIAYLGRQQEIHGVKLITETEVDKDLIEQESPDVVVIAVGGNRENKLSASGSVNLVNINDVPSANLGERIVICGAGAQAVDLALYLLAQGKKIQMVHDGLRSDIGKEHSMWVRAYERPHLFSQGVKIWNSSKIQGIEDGGLKIINQAETETLIECDTVIECYDMLPNTELFDSISDNYEAYAVGDCATPFNIADAIINGNLIGRMI